jgi:hypothetical protein
MLVAAFGAIVLGGVPPEAAPPQPLMGTAEGFARVFLAAAACLAVSLVTLLLLKEKPLATAVSSDAA